MLYVFQLLLGQTRDIHRQTVVATYQITQLGSSDKGRAIKDVVVCWALVPKRSYSARRTCSIQIYCVDYVMYDFITLVSICIALYLFNRVGPSV